jgi:hypothetical protein
MSADRGKLDPQLQLYLDKGCLVFPWDGRRTPLVPGGLHAASNDARLVASLSFFLFGSVESATSCLRQNWEPSRCAQSAARAAIIAR